MCAGKSTEDYLQVVERLGNEPVDMLEINISCPNVKEGGIAFGQDPRQSRQSQRRKSKGKAACNYEVKP